MDNEKIIAKGQQCLDIEIEALQATRNALDERFAEIAGLLHETLERGNKLIFSGVGKNKHICEKLVSTFNSIGASSCFLDPVHALHGDLGLCREGDALLAFSNSGETSELLRFLPMVRRFGVKTIAVTSKPESSLSRFCDATLKYSADREACPLDLAPTASTTAAIAIGDAVAMVLLELRAVSKEDFAKYHPGGSLGAMLAQRVEEIMRGSDRLATLPESANCEKCLACMSGFSAGCIALTGADGKLVGIMTDGDIRRYVLDKPNFLALSASEVMTRNPITIASGSYAADALKIFQTHSIDDIVVVDNENRPIGIIDGQDLTKLRIV